VKNLGGSNFLLVKIFNLFPWISLVEWLKKLQDCVNFTSTNVLDKFQPDSNSFQAFKPCAVKMRELF
jgi:hypothetical protein